MDPRSREFLQALDELPAGEAGDLPGLPEVALRIVRRLAEPVTAVGQVARLIATEPALAVRVLHAANSLAYNQLATPTDDLRVAVSRVGFDAVRRLTLHHALQQVRDAPHYLPVQDRLGAVWQRSLLMSAMARVLSALLGGVPGEVASTAGLLQGVGRTWMLARAVEHPAVLRDAVALDALLNERHAAIGRRLLGAWGIDGAWVDAIGIHESADMLEGPQPRLVDLLFTAQLFCAFRDAPEELAERIADSPAATRLGLRHGERAWVFGHSAAEIGMVRGALCD